MGCGPSKVNASTSAVAARPFPSLLTRSTPGKSATSTCTAKEKTEPDEAAVVDRVLGDNVWARASELAYQAAAQASSFNEQYHITDHATSLASQSATQAVQLSKQAAAHASAWSQEYHLSEQARDVASQGASEAVRLGKMAAAQASAWNDEYKITDQAATLASQGASEAARLGKKAAAQASAYNQEHHITEQAADLAAKGASQAATQLSDLDEMYHLTDNLMGFLTDAIAPYHPKERNVILEDTPADSQSGIWCCKS